MNLKPVYDTQDTIPEAARALYEERDGRWHLPVEGMVTSDRLNEFRANNVRLKKEMDDLSARFKDVDPDEYRTLSEQAVKIREKKLIEEGKVNELIAERVAAMQADHTKALSTLTAEKAATTRQLESLVIDSALRDAAMKAGVRATAIDDVLLRGRQTFRLEGGQAVAYKADGSIDYGTDTHPKSPAAWVGELTERAPHLFEASKGGGAQGANPAASGKRTVTRDEFNRMSHMDQAVTATSKDITIVD